MFYTLFRQQAIRFRRFSHRAYAAFASMHREVTIGHVSRSICDMELLKSGRTAVLCGVVMTSGFALADESNDGLTADDVRQQLSLQEVLVTAEKAEVNAQAYRLITTIRAEEIESLPITTVADILSYLPGVDIRTRGANGAQADISMRGGTFDQVLVMINGVNLTDAHTGHYSLNLPISPLLIERIEVLQGTSANLFGLNAFSGAINIITRQSMSQTPCSATARLSAGMNGYVHPELAVRANKGDWYLNTSADYSHANGYQAPNPSEKEATACANSDYRIANIYLQTGWRGLDIQMGAQYKDAGAGMYYGFGSQDQFDATRTAFGSATYTHRWGAWRLDAQASYRANYDRYEWHRGQRKYGNFHFTQNTSASLKAHYASRIGTTTAGIELRNENIHSTNLGDTINPNGQVPNVDGFDLKDLRVLELVRGQNRLNINYFAEQTFNYNNLNASLGVSGNYNTRFGNNFAGGANIGYQYARHGNVYLNANRSVRIPTFTDLYYDAGNQLGDPNLQPESAWTLSLGTQYATGFGPVVDGRSSNGQLSVALDAYYRWGRDIIDWVYTPEDNRRPYHATNQNRVNSTGLEATIQYRLNNWLPEVSLRYAYTYMDLDLEKTGSRYLDYLSHHLTAHLEHGIYVHHNWRIGASWTLSYKQREGQYDRPLDTADPVTGKTTETCSYQPVLLLDGSVYWQNHIIRISADCTNMTNRHYYDYGGILQPGAWAKATITVRL